MPGGGGGGSLPAVTTDAGTWWRALFGVGPVLAAYWENRETQSVVTGGIGSGSTTSLATLLEQWGLGMWTEAQMDAKIAARIADVVTGTEAFPRHHTHGYALYNVADGSELRKWTQTTKSTAAVTMQYPYDSVRNAQHQVGPYDATTAQPTVDLSALFGFGADEEFFPNEQIAKSVLVYASGPREVGYWAGSQQPVWDPAAVEAVTGTMTYSGVVGHLGSYTYDQVDQMPWEAWDCCTDGTNIYFLPGRAAGMYPKKWAAAMRLSDLTIVWQREFTSIAGQSISRSNGIVHNGTLIFWMANRWYVLNATTGELLKSIEATQDVRSDGRAEDLMLASDSLVWNDGLTAIKQIL